MLHIRKIHSVECQLKKRLRLMSESYKMYPVSCVLYNLIDATIKHAVCLSRIKKINCKNPEKTFYIYHYIEMNMRYKKK